MTKRRRVVLQTRQELEADPGEELASASVDPYGHLITLSIKREMKDTVVGTDVEEGWAVFPKASTDEPYTGVVRLYGSEGVTRVELEPISLAFPEIDRISPDEIIIAGTRCRYFQDGSHDLNARVYDLTGRLQRKFLMGDGIQDLHADGNGRIWVGYFDEGIFGNYGWGRPGGPEPIGASGLVCFDSSGDIVWEFVPVNDKYIADCYALNVSASEVWACYYESFPLVRVSGGYLVEEWATDVSGMRTIAVGGGRVAFYGGYAEKHRCVVGELGKEKVEVVEELELTTPEGKPLSSLPESSVVGRGPLLHFVVDGRVLDFDVSSL